jgi:oligoendopeptidase F
VLRRAGVDLGRPEPVQEVFNTLERLVERLEGLLV